MRIEYTNKSFPDCPQATEYSHDRESMAALSKNAGSKVNGALMFIAIISTFISLILLILLILLAKPYTQSTISESSAATVSSVTQPPATVSTKPVLEPKNRPVNGAIYKSPSSTEELTSEITVHASSQDCVVKLKTAAGETVLSFFVRANNTVTVSVPPRVLYAYFAQGDTWYGWSNYFGESTVYSKDSSSTDFSEYSIEYTLYTVSNGNLTLTPIDGNDF